MKTEILGAGRARCKALMECVGQTIGRTGIDAKIVDIVEIVSQ